MADLTNVFGGPWSPPPEKQVSPPEYQLIDAIREAGLEPPDSVQLDGKIHRFSSGTKGSSGHGDKSGWYLAFGDGVPAGRFGCWRAGVESTWRADIGRPLSQLEEMTNAKRMAEAKTLRDAELDRQHQTASDTVELIWIGAQAALQDHPYLAKKGIGVHGARATGDGRLVVPLYDKDGMLATLQYIDHEGGKLYHPGGQTSGKFWMLGTMDTPGTLYLAEGFATAASIHEASNRPCVVAYSASNLVPVLGELRTIYGLTQDICIVADHDASGVGQKYAEQASAKYGARMVMPPEFGDANDWKQSGHDLLLLLAPPTQTWLIPADEFSAQPAPISWLVKEWIQERALIMVHGPSGGGKTFAVLDWCLRMASGGGEWAGNRVKSATVVYLAGEGHHGLRGRIAAWKQYHKAGRCDMWLSKSGCDLNTLEGYRKVAEHVRSLPTIPQMIVVDTLHRFLHGDENSAQDAKTMLDACARLMEEFGCSVVLVHHTGVSDEAQHRARGSSAWRGALDIEISVVPGTPIQLIQRKSKDSEVADPVFLSLQKVEISGWFDEDELPVSSAVIEVSEAPKKLDKKDSEIAKDIRKFSNAWWATGAEIDADNNAPYLSRSGLIDYLTNAEGLSESTAKTYAQPSKNGRLIYNLLTAEMIRPTTNGWVVVDAIIASSLLIMRSDR